MNTLQRCTTNDMWIGKKALIITHIDQATPRIPGISKYLNEFGWEPVIISPTYGQKVKENSYRIVETAYTDNLKFIKYLSGAGHQPFNSQSS